MDLGDVMQELGLDAIGSSSASGASSGGQEQAPENLDGFDDFEEVDGVGEVESEAEDLTEMEEQIEMPDEEPAGTDAETTDAEVDSGTNAGANEMNAGATGMNDDRSDEILERLDDISYEIDQLATDVEENQSTIRTLRNERQELRDRMDSIEDHNAKMLGIYDRLTNEINPFAADWDERYDQKVSEQDGPEYGVIEPPDDEIDLTPGEGDGGATDGGVGSDTTADVTPEPDEDDAVSFDDLKHKHGEEADPESADENVTDGSAAEPTERTDPEQPSGEGSTDNTTTGSATSPRSPGNGNGDGVEGPADPVEEPPIDPSTAGAAVEGAPGTPEASDGPYLSTLAPTVATEVLIMEWLTFLIDIAGPAGAMKALDFYERIGWISADMKRQLEDVLSGARERGDQPSRPPSDLTADEHNRSFAHIVRLAQQAQLARSREG